MFLQLQLKNLKITKRLLPLKEDLTSELLFFTDFPGSAPLLICAISGNVSATIEYLLVDSLNAC